MARVEELELLDVRDTSVERLLQKAREIRDSCTDYTVTKANHECMRFNDDAELSYITSVGEVRHSPMSRYALSQLCTKIGVPTNYIDKCVDSGRIELAQDNVNSWLMSFNKDLLIREYNDSIRGILSTKYSICDTDEILETVDGVLNLDHFNIKGYYLTPERFHLRMTLKERMNIEGEDLFAGLSFDSSDVGKSILRVRFLVFKQVCTNGLIVSKSSNQLFHQKHIGISSEEFAEGLEESIKIFPDFEGVEDMIINASSESTYKFRGITQEQFDDLVVRITRETPVSAEEARKVISIMQEGRYEDSKWGYINALTDVAKELTLEKRLEVEEYAGSLLVA